MLQATLVIPVYNESVGIARLLARVDRIARDLGPGWRILIVEDGSTDDTGAQLEAAAARPGVPFRLVRHPRNRGYGAALKTGLAHAETEWIGIADADGTYPIGRLAEFAARAADGADMVVGVRPLAQQPAVRRPAKAFLNAYATYLAGQPVPDLNSGLRLFRRADALRHKRLLPDGFSFTSTITLALLGEGARVDWIPIRYRERTGSSKIRPVRDMLFFLLVVARMALAFNPLKVFVPISAVLTGIGVALLVARMVVDHAFGVATTVTFLVGGLQVLALGLLADLVNRRGS